MSDTTVTPEERASWRKRLESPLSCHDSKHGAFTLRLLTALEAAEARAEKAEAALATAMSMNAERQAEVTENVINNLIAGITGQKQSVKVSVGGYQCPYCNVVFKTLEDATAHDATCPAHPAVMRAKKAEAENARLRAERDWLAAKLKEFARWAVGEG